MLFCQERFSSAETKVQNSLDLICGKYLRDFQMYTVISTVLIKRNFDLFVICGHQVLFQLHRRYRHHQVYPHQPRLVYQLQLHQGIRESKFL